MIRQTRTYALKRGQVVEVGPGHKHPIARVWPTETKWATRLIRPYNARWSVLGTIQYWPTEERAMRRVEEALKNLKAAMK